MLEIRLAEDAFSTGIVVPVSFWHSDMYPMAQIDSQRTQTRPNRVYRTRNHIASDPRVKALFGARSGEVCDVFRLLFGEWSVICIGMLFVSDVHV